MSLPTGANAAEWDALMATLSPAERLGAMVTTSLGKAEELAAQEKRRADAAERDHRECLLLLAGLVATVRDHGWVSSWAAANDSIAAAVEYVQENTEPEETPDA